MAKANSSSTVQDDMRQYPVATVFDEIERLLGEIERASSKAYSVTSLGAIYAGRLDSDGDAHDPVLRDVLETVEDILGDTSALNRAKTIVADLKRRTAPLLADENGGAK